MASEPYWKTLALEEMNPEQWEALCDHCARCCLYKLEDEETGEIFYTNVVCKLLNVRQGICTAYDTRAMKMPTCLKLTPELARSLPWLPKTCAYRLLAEGRDLFWWHPLICGDASMVIKAGISVRDKIVMEEDVDMSHLEDTIVDWFD